MDPSKLDILLDEAYKLLFNDEWDSRVAGGLVFDDILKHVTIAYNDEDDKTFSLSVQGYDIQKVIRNRSHLTQSNAEPTSLDIFLQQHCTENDLISLSLLQRIGIISTQQEATLNKLKSEYMEKIKEKTNARCDVKQDEGEDFSLQKMESYLEELKETESVLDCNTNKKAKKRKLKEEDFTLLMNVRCSLHPKNEITDDHKSRSVIVFNEWYRRLMPFMLHSNWKYRHGAAIGLRSFLHKSMKSFVCSGDNLFAEGCAMCLSVLILDRFADFQSDILIAPISETVAQCLSLLMKYVDNASFISIIELLSECVQEKDSWNIRYAGFLAFKYILAVHYQQIIELKDAKLVMKIIELSCDGIKDNMEDVANMASQVLLSNISVFITNDNCHFEKTQVQNTVFNALLYALGQIDAYSSSTLGLMSVFHCVLNEFRELMIEYIEKQNVDKDKLFSNIFHILMKIMHHSSISMKKQSIATLHTLMQFVTHLKHNYDIDINVNKKDIITLIENVFEKIMCEQYNKIKETIDVMKDNDFDEYQMDLQYKLYIKQLQDMWLWLCAHLQHLLPVSPASEPLPIEYQHMILKLFQIFQKYATFKTSKQNKKEDAETLPTAKVLDAIEQRKQSKKRKQMQKNVALEPPLKKRKLSSNDNHVQNIKTMAPSTSTQIQNDYAQEITLWDMIDSGCKLLSKLFTSSSLNTSSWRIVQHLIMQFLSQENTKKKKKKYKHIVYGWRRVLGCWLLADCYHQLKAYENEHDENKENIEITNVLCKLQNITHGDIYDTYDEFKYRRKIMVHETNNLIESFSSCDSVYKEMNEYFNDDVSFKHYIEGIMNKYNEWNQCGSGDDGCYKTLLATVLNAQYALDHHSLLLQCSVSHIFINNNAYRMGMDTENILKPVISAFNNGQNGNNLQYRSAECVALMMKILADQNEDETSTKIVKKLWNNIIQDCRDNIDVVPKDSTRMVIQCICGVFGDDVFDKLPFILDEMREIMEVKDEDGFYSDTDWMSIVQIFCCFISSVSSSEMRDKYLLQFISDVMFDGIFMFEEDEADEEEMWSICRQSRYCIIEYLQFDTHVILSLIIKHIVPNLKKEAHYRLGAIQIIWDILYLVDNIQSIEMQQMKSQTKHQCNRYQNYSQRNLRHHSSKLLLNIIPYLSLLTVPLLDCMTDFDDAIRKRANQIFSISVRLIPLDIGLQTSSIKQMPSTLCNEREANIGILSQFIDPSTINEFKCPFKYHATLRHYQQDGVNWLWFLHKFHLHGILADDMGLGKTLQALLVITAAYVNDNDSNKKEASLIICPATLLYHWQHEINKFIPSELLTPVVIDGKPKKRHSAYKQLHHDNDHKNMVVIVSYNTMKNDIQYIAGKNIKWHYTVLDEGHLIKNPKSKISRAVKTISSKYRLILSGTPIQNNVLDLWSLFDFLMPGFLGTEKWFKSNFSAPIKNSYKSKTKSKSALQRLGALKLEHLHKQCLPFIMRRLKCDVLKELPPKIIQDVEVNMSSIQTKLYKQFVNSERFASIDVDINKINNNKINKSSFESLLYLRKLVIHPKLVMTKQHPSFTDTLQTLQENNLSLESIEIAPKFIALKALIEQCLNINDTDDNCSKLMESHRMLIFVQYTEVMQLIQRLLLDKYFPHLQYKTLSGKLSNQERFHVVQEFNKKDSPLSLLLLTVNVGGLGLNLNTADVVVFMEMDWNPMKDLQAMDRAHRIGQTKTVHVFRIIVRNTIEWEIMNKQRFKQYIANTVISKQNTSFASIATNSGSILDLFYMNNQNNNSNNDNIDNNQCLDAFGKVNEKTKKQKSLHHMLDSLENMTVIHQQYAQQYDLKAFISNLQ